MMLTIRMRIDIPEDASPHIVMKRAVFALEHAVHESSPMEPALGGALVVGDIRVGSYLVEVHK